MLKFGVFLMSFVLAGKILAADRGNDDLFLQVDQHHIKVSRDGGVPANWIELVRGEKKDDDMSDDDQVQDAASPLEVYIPYMRDDASATATPHPSYVGGLVMDGEYKVNANNTMPIVVRTGATTTFTGSFKTTLKLAKRSNIIQDTDFYLVVAAKKEGGSSYKFLQNAQVSKADGGVVAADGILRNNTTYVDSYEISFNLEKLRILDVDASAGQQCFAASESPCVYDVVFFLSTTRYNNVAEDSIESSAIDADYGGVYYRLSFSPKFYEGDGLRITRVQDSDGQATLHYGGGTANKNSYALVAVDRQGYTPTTTTIDGKPLVYFSKNPGLPIKRMLIYREYSGNTEDQFSAESGSFVVDHLYNGQNYLLGMMVVDRYQFSTPITNFEAAAPDEIVAFIQKQSCFFLSAGFGHRHFVIDYFKNWRDNFLQKFALGRSFIRWYYATAPQYTHLIYQHRPVQIAVQGLGYVAYVLVRFWYGLMAVLLGVILGWGWYRRRKTV